MYDEIDITPTEELYSWLNKCFTIFNQRLFDNRLPPCMFTLQRKFKTAGYFSSQRWASKSGAVAHEISLNPAIFGTSTLVEIFQTMVHEMVHLWQHVYGVQKSRRAYHNLEFASKMESIGLMPSSTGRPGGKKTGQSMSDYPVLDGAFLAACESVVAANLDVVWVDRYPVAAGSTPIIDDDSRSDDDHAFPAPIHVSDVLTRRVSDVIPNLLSHFELDEPSSSDYKAKYTCPRCGCNVWGKQKLSLSCNRCQLDLEVTG